MSQRNGKAFFIALLLNAAFYGEGLRAEVGKLCSVVQGRAWGVAHSENVNIDPCENAHRFLKERFALHGESGEFTPPFEIYVQSFYSLDSENEVVAVCEDADNERLIGRSGKGSLPIIAAVQEAQESRYPRCRFTVKENLNGNTPMVGNLAMGYCLYENDRGEGKLRISKSGWGRDAACAGARQDMGGRPIVRRSAGYFWTSGFSTNLSYACANGTAGQTEVKDAAGVLAFREQLERSGARGCVIASDVMGSYGLGGGGTGWNSTPGGGAPISNPASNGVVFVPPPVEAIIEGTDKLNEEFATQYSFVRDQRTVQDVPYVYIDEGQRTATIHSPQIPYYQQDLANQRSLPPGVIREGGVVNGQVQSRKRSANTWTYGSGMLLLTVGYDAQSPLWHTANANAFMDATAFNQNYSIASVQGQSALFRENNRLGIDVLLTSKVLGKSSDLMKRRFWTKSNEELPKKALLRATLFAAKQQFAVGPVPVLVTVQVVGELGYDKTGFYLDVEDMNRAGTLAIKCSPYGFVDVIGTAGVGIPTANAGIMGQVSLVSGELFAMAGTYAYEQNGQLNVDACIDAGVKDLTVLKGKLYAYYMIKDPATPMVSKFVGGVCSSAKKHLKFLKAVTNGCNAAQGALDRVGKLTSLMHKQTAFEWDGYQIAKDHYWYDTCQK